MSKVIILISKAPKETELVNDIPIKQSDGRYARGTAKEGEGIKIYDFTDVLDEIKQQTNKIPYFYMGANNDNTKFGVICKDKD